MWFGVTARTGYQKDMSSKEFGLHAPITITIINSIVNRIVRGEGSHDQSMSRRILTSLMNKIIT
jgi:hypothetical protein